MVGGVPREATSLDPPDGDGGGFPARQDHAAGIRNRGAGRRVRHQRGYRATERRAGCSPPPSGRRPLGGVRGPAPRPGAGREGKEHEASEAAPQPQQAPQKRRHQHRHRSPERPSPQRGFFLHSALDATREQGLVAKSRPGRPRSPPSRAAPAELRYRWTQQAQWESPLLPPPGTWTGRALGAFEAEWPVE